jgi:glycosyltransferase involved in cell wall biosynthesis
MHLIVFSHLRWDFVLQRPQHVLSRLADHYEVLFVEEPVPCDIGQQRLEATGAGSRVTVLRPHTSAGGPGFSDAQAEPIRQMLDQYLDREGIVDYVVWLYTPMALPLLDSLQPRAIVYDCMDELSAFKNAPSALRELESELLDVADIVFTGGPSLHEAKRGRHANVLCLPSAVDATHYSPARALADKEAVRRASELQSAVGHPRLGFFGVIDERLDLDLVYDLAAQHPHWHVVMVGPVVKISPDDLPLRPNIHWLGQQPYDLLPQLVASWDVCLLPFALNESTRFISPTKTLEYMAAQKPVVSTPVHDVVVLYGEQVRIAAAGPAFIDACRASLGESQEEATRRNAGMLDMVARHSWDRTALAMHQAIDAVLAGRAALLDPA